MTPRVLVDLRAAVRLVRLDRGRVWLPGAPIGALPRTALERRAFLRRLSEALYSRWFTRAGAVGQRARAVGLPDLVAAVRAAHAAAEGFEPGWTATAVGPGGAVMAQRDAEVVPVQPLDYANLSRPGAPVRAGDALAVVARRDGLDESGAWWLAWHGAHASETAPQFQYTRTCGPDAVVPLVRQLTTRLAERALPYQMKCPSRPALFDRLDPVVLYLSAEAWLQARQGLREVHRVLGDRLRPPVPPMTLPLGRGVALAEDPLDGRSFGQSRADAVAEGLLNALQARVTRAEDAVHWLAAALQAGGISPLRPHLRSAAAPDTLGGW